MNTGYYILKHTKDDGAYVYCSDAYINATGATGAGGALQADAEGNEWNRVRFINIVGTGGSFPTGYTTPSTHQHMSTGTVIGAGKYPTGDVRGEGTGYVNVGGVTPHTLSRNVTYSGALYAIYEGTYNPVTGLVGLGPTEAAIDESGYYTGSFTTPEFFEFDVSILLIRVTSSLP